MGKEIKTQASDRRQFWQAAIEAHRQSGLSVAAFCKHEDITEASFYYWRKKLTKNNSGPVRQEVPSFIEVTVPGRGAPALELLLASGNTLRIAPGVNIEKLEEVISVLRRSGLC